jgi:hypothetical protein
MKGYSILNPCSPCVGFNYDAMKINIYLEHLHQDHRFEGKNMIEEINMGSCVEINLAMVYLIC